MMKNYFLLLLLSLVSLTSLGQATTETYYYDKDWKGVESKDFAAFYRVISISNDANYQNRFRDFYITGELESEGKYISIDKYDDANSVLDGDIVSYYKSGNVKAKYTIENGKIEGEYSMYYENGQLYTLANFKNGELDGKKIVYSDNGIVYFEYEYSNGEPAKDYYTVKYDDGEYKVKIADNKPIYETPDLSEIKIEYEDGATWFHYDKNGIKIAMANSLSSGYGKVFEIRLVIVNNSMHPVDFNPDNITANIIDTKGNDVALEVYSSEDYLKKVRKKQLWNYVLFAPTAVGAGKTTTTQTTTSSGSSRSNATASAYGTGGQVNASASGTTKYGGTTTTTTTTYDGTSAFIANEIADEKRQEMLNDYSQERADIEEGYLKKTTIKPGDVISGLINIKRIKGDDMTVKVNVGGIIYTFPWSIPN